MDTCSGCRGTQWRAVRDGILERCGCYKRIEPDESQLREMHLPQRWYAASLDQYVPRNPAQQRAVDLVNRLSRYVEDRGGIAVPFGAVLTGPPGAGKTHLAATYLKELQRSGFQGIYAHYPEWVEAIRKSLPADPPAVAAFRMLLDADVVLLDDVRLLTGIPPAAADAASALIKRIYNQVKTVILTSRLPLVDPENAGRESLTLELGYSAVSRLMGTCAICDLAATW